MKHLFYIAALSMVFAGCLKEDDLNKGYAGYKPRDIGDGWKTGSCLQNNIDSSSLEGVMRSVYDNDSYWAMRSLSVFRNGEIIGEAYLKDEADRTQPRAIWSCTKQVLSLTIGVLFDQNLVFPADRIGQFLEKYLPGHADKKDITIEQLLTMRSGIDFNNDEHSDVFRKKEVNNSVDFVLSRPFRATPGNSFNYNDGDPQLISATIQSLAREPADRFAKTNIFETIGFRNYEWRRYSDGVTMGAFGILTTPREIAKIGQLVLNKGLWDSTQVVSEEYLNLMLSKHSTHPSFPYLDFGYYWWIHPDKNYWIMWGHGGQFVVLMPDKNAMIVITSLEQIEDDYTVWIDDAISLADRIGKTMQ